MTKIILVRHGHVEGISPERFRGRADLPLTETGRRQAAATSRYVAASWRPSAVFTSPLSRCRAVAAAIGQPLDLEPEIAAGLIDIDYGDWQGLTPAEARAQWPDLPETWYRAPEQARIPGGETLVEVRDRAAEALREIIRKHPRDTVVAVAHDVVNRVLLLHALAAPLACFWRIRQDPCGVNEIEADDDRCIVLAVNHTSHLRDL
jgi:phosphoserine phosphatase